MKNRRQRLTQSAEAHRTNMIRNLQHRLEVARAKGDESLVQLLEAEANYIGLSN